jgi:hypothetical protein
MSLARLVLISSCEVTATDCSECMVDVARRKAEEGVAVGDCGKIVVERMGVENLRYPDDHFDTGTPHPRERAASNHSWQHRTIPGFAPPCAHAARMHCCQ